MRDWQKIIDRERRRPNCASFNLATYWRGKAYVEQPPGLPEALGRALAFKRVLDHLPLPITEVDELCGESSWLVAQLPTGLAAAEYQQAVEAASRHPQRSFWAGVDHTLPDFDELLSIGLQGYLERLAARLQRPASPAQRAMLEAMRTTVAACSEWIARAAVAAGAAGRADLAAILARVARQPPATLHQAMQLTWLVYIALCSEGRHAMALGRLDQYLLRFYRGDLGSGVLTREQALELFCHLWCRIEGLHEVVNLCVGGLTPDGGDASNELSLVCLEATARVQSPSTNLSARFHDGSPAAFHRACARTILTGVGFPAIFNDHVTIPALEKLGVPTAVARDHCMVGCIETMLPGRQPAWGDSRFNLPLHFSSALEKLRGMPAPSYAELLAIFRQEVADRLREHVALVNGELARQPAAQFPDPFLSALTHDCIERGLDLNDGGARFPRFHGVAGMGLGTIADSIAAVKKLVFEERVLPFEALMKALDDDFAGGEEIRQTLLNRAPKYGNDHAYVDAIAREVAELFCRECLAHHTVDGGRFVPLLAANIQNISAGKEIKATPDGRRAWTPISDAASPYFGRDLKGPTAFLNSVASPDYTGTAGGSVVNMRFSPDMFPGERGVDLFTAFTKTFVSRRIQEMQFNLNRDETLREALADPERYRHLVVRVSGFSAYFVQLAPEVQDDILRRRAHGVEG